MSHISSSSVPLLSVCIILPARKTYRCSSTSIAGAFPLPQITLLGLRKNALCLLDLLHSGRGALFATRTTAVVVAEKLSVKWVPGTYVCLESLLQPAYRVPGTRRSPSTNITALACCLCSRFVLLPISDQAGGGGGGGGESALFLCPNPLYILVPQTCVLFALRDVR